MTSKEFLMKKYNIDADKVSVIDIEKVIELLDGFGKLKAWEYCQYAESCNCDSFLTMFRNPWEQFDMWWKMNNENK